MMYTEVERRNLPELDRLAWAAGKLGASLHQDGESKLVIARGDPKELLNHCSTVLLEGKEVVINEAIFFYILTCVDAMVDDGGDGTELIGFGRRTLAWDVELAGDHFLCLRMEQVLHQQRPSSYLSPLRHHTQQSLG